MDVHPAPAPVDKSVGEDSFAPFGCPLGHGAPAAGARPRRRRGYFLPGLLALIATLAIGAAANIGGLDHGGPTRLAGSDVSTFVSQGLEADQGLSNPPPISCPASEPVRAGLRFACEWRRSASTQPVMVTETDGRGQFRFSLTTTP